MTPSQSNESLLSGLAAFSKDQIKQAGQRYTPGIDPQAPNLRIELLVTAIENAACGAGALDRFKAFLRGLSEAWDRAKYCSQRSGTIQDKIDSASAFISPMIDRLRARDEAAGEEWSDRLSAIDSELSADMEHWRAEAARLVPEGEDGGYRERLRVEQCLAKWQVDPIFGRKRRKLQFITDRMERALYFFCTK